MCQMLNYISAVEFLYIADCCKSINRKEKRKYKRKQKKNQTNNCPFFVDLEHITHFFLKCIVDIDVIFSIFGIFDMFGIFGIVSIFNG